MQVRDRQRLHVAGNLKLLDLKVAILAGEQTNRAGRCDARPNFLTVDAGLSVTVLVTLDANLLQPILQLESNRRQRQRVQRRVRFRFVWPNPRPVAQDNPSSPGPPQRRVELERTITAAQESQTRSLVAAKVETAFAQRSIPRP